MKTLLKTALVSSVALASSALAPAAFAGETLEIRDFIGSINWSNGPMSVEIEDNADDTKISGSSAVIIDGGIETIDASDCESAYGHFDINWFGKKSEGRFGGYKDLEDYPVLNITVPADTKLVIQNSILFTLGEPDIEEADLELRHCGKVTLGDVENTLALDSRGSADVSVGRTGQIAASMRGSGDLDGGDSGDVIAKLQGSGDIDLGDLGSLEMSLNGSGDLEAGDVNGPVDLSSNGSGDVDLGNVTGALNYSSFGSGDLEALSVTGSKLDLISQGSGGVDIDGGNVGNLNIAVRGSGGVKYLGEAESAVLNTRGSGDIRVERVNGAAEIESAGSGDVDIDQRG